MGIRGISAACVIGLASIALSGCYFSAGQQVFSKADFTRIEPARLEPVVEYYSKERNPKKYILSAVPQADGTVRLNYFKNGRVLECDLGFVYLQEPVGYFIITNVTKSCSFFADSEKAIIKYYYIVAANVPVERIPNPIMRAYVRTETATFIWPYRFTGASDNFHYLAKKQNIEVERLGDFLLLVRAVEDMQLSPADESVMVIKNENLGKGQLQNFMREAIRFGFFSSPPMS